MELPNYSRQLLLQMHTLCKEQQFCDCTIFIDTMHFRAHKLVLAAASLLFKSFLDDTDTIAIDPSIVTPEEFTLLLEIVYTGKLPPGKHNFTKVISVADSLQMFDVAVSCKNVLTDLMNRSTKSQMMLGGSVLQSDGTRKDFCDAPQVKVCADDGTIPMFSKHSPALSCTVQSQPVTIVEAAEIVPDLAEEVTAPEPSMIVTHEDSGNIAAIETWETVTSPETLGTATGLKDFGMMGTLEDLGTVYAPKTLRKVAASGNLNMMAGPAPSETASTFLPPSEVEVTGPAPSEVATGPAPCKVVTGSTPCETLTGPAPVVAAAPGPAPVVAAPGPAPVVAAGTAPGPAPVVAAGTAPGPAPVVAAGTAPGPAPVVAAGTAPGPARVVAAPGPITSEPVTGCASSDVATHLTACVLATGPTPSVLADLATRAEISLCATGSVARGMGTASIVSGSAVAIAEALGPLSTTKILGLAAASAEAERLSPPVDSIVAVTLAELDAGGLQKQSHTSVISAKFEACDNREGPEAPQSETMTETKILEQETHEDCRFANEESDPSTVRSSAASSDYGTAKDVDEVVEPPMKKGRFMKPEAISKCNDLDFLLQYEEIFLEALSDTPTVLSKLSSSIELEDSEKQEFLEFCQGGESESAFKRLLEKAKDGQVADVQTVLYVLELCRDTHPGVHAAFRHREQILTAAQEQTGSQEDVKTLFVLLLEHKEELIQSITEMSPIIECLDTAEDGFLSNLEKKVILDCWEGRSHRDAMEELLEKVKDEKSLRAASLVKLLQAVKEAFPDLCLLLDALESQVKITAQLSPEEYGIELLRQHYEHLAEILTDPQLLLRGLAAAVNLSPRERKVMEQIVKKDSCSSSFRSLASAVLEEKTLSAMACWQLLLALQEGEIPLNTLLEDIQREPGAELFFQSVVKRETVATEILLRHSELIAEAIRESDVREWVTPGEEGLTDTAKEMLRSLCEKEDCGVSCVKQFLISALDKSIPTMKFCQLLCSLHESFPNLQPLMQELEQMGLLTERDGEIKDIRKWKVNQEYQIEALVKEEGLNPEPMEVEKAITVCGKDKSVPQKKEGKRVTISSSKKNFVCKYCNKIFHFRCRLAVHVKRCRMAHEKPIKCEECNELRTSKKEMERHKLEAHGYSSAERAARARKKRLFVTCDICGKEFAHPSGMQYHKRTEHFDEKPFPCSECGAKFAANSTLKNHQRLHTGERPFMCKHCHMTFTQAAALAYHTKKKHSEGKMYACQYCNGVFAQSIELTRHVRTHTGDKPYVCRECGKGFSQANGLSVHLRTFHNIEDVYDCQKCRMSFPTFDEHRKHIQEVHSKEYHPCSTCGKIFSAQSLLERHMVSHVGVKPYNCEICDKAYQQLSGIWYHNRTHHPDIFAAQNHRSSKFSSLTCISCDKGFSSATALQKHVKAEHADMKLPECDKCQQIFTSPAALQIHMKCKHSGSQPFRCLYCSDAFRFPGALQHHVATEHFSETENTFGCQLCGELFTSQLQLHKHYEIEHPEVVISEGQVTSTQVVQVIHTPEQIDSSEQVITMDESQLAASQLIVTVPDSQGGQNGSELLAVCMKDLLDGTVTLICGETK